MLFINLKVVPAKIFLPKKENFLLKKSLQIANFKPQKCLRTSPSLVYLIGLYKDNLVTDVSTTWVFFRELLKADLDGTI